MRHAENCNLKKGPKDALWICYTCHRKIGVGKLPAKSVVNSLHLESIPPEMNILNTMEQHIPFMKLLALPKGGQNVPIVCVASNLAENSNDHLICMKLRIKLTYKGHYEYWYVNTNKIRNASAYLQEHNRFYENISTDWCNPLSRTEELESCTTVNISDNDEFPETLIDDNVDESLYDGQQHNMLMDTFATS